jgi:hypothetical protein
VKSTTGSQLAEQAYHDYRRESQPTDQKVATAFTFNTYATRFGLPMRLTPTSPTRIARICRVAVTSIPNTRWLQEQITEAWGLK